MRPGHRATGEGDCEHCGIHYYWTRYWDERQQRERSKAWEDKERDIPHICPNWNPKETSQEEGRPLSYRRQTDTDFASSIRKEQVQEAQQRLYNEQKKPVPIAKPLMELVAEAQNARIAVLESRIAALENRLHTHIQLSPRNYEEDQAA